MGVALCTVTLRDSRGTQLLPVPVTLGSACLECLVPVGGIFSPGGTAVIRAIELVVETAHKPLLAPCASQSTGKEGGSCTLQSD